MRFGLRAFDGNFTVSTKKLSGVKGRSMERTGSNRSKEKSDDAGMTYAKTLRERVPWKRHTDTESGCMSLPWNPRSGTSVKLMLHAKEADEVCLPLRVYSDHPVPSRPSRTEDAIGETESEIKRTQTNACEA